MAACGHDMRDVELVEADGPPGVAPTGAGRPRPPHAGRVPVPGRRRRSGLAVLVLVAVLVGGDVTADARARAGLTRLAGVPGVAGPLDRPVVELWRGHRALGPELAEAGTLLVGVLSARGGAVVVGLDARTGAVAWRTVVRRTGPRGTGGGARCVVPAAPGADPRHVVCVVDRAAARPTTAARPEREPGTIAADRLLALDAATGAVAADRAVDRSTVLASLRGDVVTGHVDDDGYVQVVRADPLTAQVRWRFTAPVPLPRSLFPWATRVRVQDGVVVVDGSDGWALAADGTVLHSWSARRGSQPEGPAQVLAGGRYLARPEPGDGSVPRTRVTDLRTGRSFVVDGTPVAARPDDGTADDRVLVRPAGTGGLVALDPAGRPVWSLPGGVQGRAAVLGGRLYRVGAGELSAVDARSGAALWSTPFARTARTSLVTDGRVAVLTRLDPEGGVLLSAYDLADGRERWTVDVADDVAALLVPGRRLLGWSGQGVVALGRPSSTVP